MDHLDKQTRSWNMSRIRSRDTSPEITVRKMLHRLGYRFRLHVRSLPGTPDIVLPKYRTVIFVNGCFWHRHQGCRRCTMPSTRVEYWKKKFERNVEKDKMNLQAVKKLGWNPVVVWECEIRDMEKLESKLTMSPTVLNPSDPPAGPTAAGISTASQAASSAVLPTGD